MDKVIEQAFAGAEREFGWLPGTPKAFKLPESQPFLNLRALRASVGHFQYLPQRAQRTRSKYFRVSSSSAPLRALT
jgi:hypothetical protein